MKVEKLGIGTGLGKRPASVFIDLTVPSLPCRFGLYPLCYPHANERASQRPGAELALARCDEVNAGPCTYYCICCIRASQLGPWSIPGA